jgi:DNA topoisomerase I
MNGTYEVQSCGQKCVGTSVWAQTDMKPDADKPISDIPLLQQPEEAARTANLYYVSGDEPGYSRKRWGRGFTYLDQDGNHIQDSELRRRFKALAIPPAWTDVWICENPKGHIQATGRDDKGRKQYIYHPRWMEKRNTIKFNSMIHFGQALPRLRRQVDTDLRRHALTCEKVTALAISILEETLIRIGNEAYAHRNSSYGLTTLQEEHLSLFGSHIQIEFKGKRGILQKVDVRDRRLARQIARCHELSGQSLFSYLDEAGQVCSLTSTDVNAYLKEHMGHDFTAKNFRIWGATVMAFSLLYETEQTTDPEEKQKQVGEMVKQVAAALGNTVAVCRQYYIHPHVIETYLAGELWERATVQEPIAGLSDDETAVLQLLRSSE